jgi:hypothetical protein
MSDQNWSVSAGRFVTVPAGVYDAIVKKLEKTDTTYRGETRELVRWYFTIPSLDDAEVTAISSLSLGAKAKPAEWARRILGMSQDTDMLWGKDARGKKEPVNWGPEELEGKPCQIAVEIREDSEGSERSNVVNVFAPGSFDSDATAVEEEADSVAF